MILAIIAMILIWCFLFAASIVFLADCKSEDDKHGFFKKLIVSVAMTTTIVSLIFFTEVSKETYSRLSEEVHGEHGKLIQHYAKDGRITTLEEGALFFNSMWRNLMDEKEQNEKELDMEKKKLLDKVKQTQ